MDLILPGLLILFSFILIKLIYELRAIKITIKEGLNQIKKRIDQLDRVQKDDFDSVLDNLNSLNKKLMNKKENELN